MTTQMSQPEFIALKIDSSHIYYRCPDCFTKYKKDGTPYKNAKNLIHKHGSCNDLSNRIEHRSHHRAWNFPNNNETYSSCYIIINEDTEREKEK
jgi:hypothetical protein